MTFLPTDEDEFHEHWVRQEREREYEFLYDEEEDDSEPDDCPRCRGTGERWGNDCPFCDGTGYWI